MMLMNGRDPVVPASKQSCLENLEAYRVWRLGDNVNTVTLETRAAVLILKTPKPTQISSTSNTY